MCLKVNGMSRKENVRHLTGRRLMREVFAKEQFIFIGAIRLSLTQSFHRRQFTWLVVGMLETFDRQISNIFTYVSS